MGKFINTDFGTKDMRFDKYADRLPKFDAELREIFLNLISDYDGDGDEIDPNETEEIINFINSNDGYILVYHDSDGRMWYDSVPNNLDILKYVIKKEDRKELGMNCRQYIDCIIYQGENHSKLLKDEKI